jgi:hypothetical protein
VASTGLKLEFKSMLVLKLASKSIPTDKQTDVDKQKGLISTRPTNLLSLKTWKFIKLAELDQKETKSYTQSINR